MSEVKCTHPDLRWVVLGPAERKRYIRVRCTCPAGREKEIDKYDFMKGANLSCGCLQKERARAAQTKHGHSCGAGQKRESLTYSTWCNMRARCENPNGSGYHNYGGRGIKVCEWWRGDDGFANFLEDMGECPLGHEIDRIDVNGDYKPANCRWVTPQQNCQNQRKTWNVTYNGKTQCVTAWEREMGLPRSTIGTRLKLGWDVERAMTTPVDPTKSPKGGGGRQVTYNGRAQNIPAWAKEFGIAENVLRARLGMGWPIERALTESVQDRQLLTASQIDEVRRRYDKGSYANGGPALAQEFGVSQMTISRIVNGIGKWANTESTG